MYSRLKKPWFPYLNFLKIQLQETLGNPENWVSSLQDFVGITLTSTKLYDTPICNPELEIKDMHEP